MSRAELKKKGFTIIEVVLVLAIAALIFLMVFIALPALQRNQRDQARKTFQSKVASAVTSYQSNKRGAQPASAAALAAYADGDKDASGNYTGKLDNGNYTLQVIAQGSGTTATANSDNTYITVVTGAKCNSTADNAVAGTTRQAAILMKMENGDSLTCVDV